MGATPLGFRPPAFALGAELEWVLRRSFGPSGWTPKAAISGSAALDIALRLDVAARLAARQPRELLERELGAASAQRLREQYVATVARSALLDHALNQLLERAAEAEITCILLKYAALNRMGVLRVGSRVASDIDVLVPHGRARELQAVLRAKGYQDLGLPESSHQLPALQDPNGVLIELHLHVPSVTLAPRLPFVRVEDLLAAGLTVASDRALLPYPAIVAAHAVSHGLVQHAHVPHVYCPLKTFADLADLEQQFPDLLEQACVYLSAMAPADLASVKVLARALREGDLELAMGGGAGVLLRHALASQLDRGYAIRLRLSGLARSKPTSVHRTPGQLFAALREAWGWARSRPPNRI